MIEYSWKAWAGFIFFLCLSTMCGQAVSRLIPWSDNARLAKVPLATGIGSSVFLLGLGSVLALGLLPGFSHAVHIVAVIVWLILITGCATYFGTRRKSSSPTRVPANIAEMLLGLLVLIWALALLINATFLPLTQNDALEYATVGRILFETRDLSSYPVLHPDQNAAGFFGPWTHPPLYVSLIYLTHAIQGHADAPGLMRLIAPLTIVASTALVFSLGSMINRMTGVLAAQIFISIPLLFLGADSALIDALPVLGFLLIVAVIAGVQASAVIRGVAIGLALGLSLWTHSQAILFIPLTCFAVLVHRGWSNRRALIIEWSVLLSVAALLAGWPYMRNIALFGSPISDNPAVFALPEQAWPEYFSVARGLEHWTAIVQYGWFKGWFALEAYGYAFWLMLFGIMTYIWKVAYHPRSFGSEGKIAGILPIFWLFLGLLAFYVAGMVVPSLIGANFMTASERNILEFALRVLILAAWLMLLGFITYLVLLGSQRRNSGKTISLDRSMPMINMSLALVACYLVGVVSSTILGIDLMIKNERYMLVIMPFVALTGGLGLARLIAPWDKDTTVSKSAYAIKAPRIVSTGVILFFLAQLMVVANYRHYANGLTIAELGKSFEETLKARSEYLVVDYLRTSTPRGSLVLSLKPADMYYADRRMLSYLDPRLLGFYKERDPEAAYAILRSLGVTHVHVPNYGLPPLYNSELQQILRRPEWSTLLYSSDGNQIYALRPSGLAAATIQDITPSAIPWIRTTSFVIGGRKAFGNINAGHSDVKADEESVGGLPLSLFHRDSSTTLTTGSGTSMQSGGIVSILGDQEYGLDLQLEGKGFVRVWLQQYDFEGKVLKGDHFRSQPRMALGDLVLGNTYPHRLFTKRIRTLPGAHRVALSVEHRGSSRLKITNAQLVQLR